RQLGPFGQGSQQSGYEGVPRPRGIEGRHSGPHPLQQLDTTGAGDAFVAGLLAALAERTSLPTQAELPAILAQAHGCGALATTAKGAMTALPTRTRLDEFLRSGADGC
ncbi:PfkB family carbohydrate kinase, partial [Aeromonas caviae]|uniref:PfkB family carbohydrate kinase n=1 Tax=Aeromonas caviae TaxID=648 RepID=UPI001F392DE9